MLFRSAPLPQASVAPVATPAVYAPYATSAPNPTAAPDTRTSATLATPEQLAAQPLGGFKPGSGAVIEVTGARTVAAVVVPPDFETMAAESIEASFRDSANREREQFAAAERFSVTTGAPSGNENPRTITAEGQRILTESELAGARTLSATEQNAQGKWVKVATSVSTYEPGSMVYLVATSEIGRAHV